MFGFNTPLRSDLLSYSVSPNTVGNATASEVHSNTVVLDDVVYPDTVIDPERGYIDDLHPDEHPSYDNPFARELVFEPGQFRDYDSISIHDQSTPQDVGSIPGTAYQNITHGPVTGNAIDCYPEGPGLIAQVGARTPGQFGPVSGGEDYGVQVSASYWQSQMAQYSAAASDAAMVSAL